MKEKLKETEYNKIDLSDIISEVPHGICKN
jgi:hypothetical protein